MRDTATTTRLTVLIILTAMGSAWLLSTGSQGWLASISAGLLVATLGVLLAWFSVWTRWYIRELVQAGRPEDEHETTVPSKAKKGCRTRPERTRVTRFARGQRGRTVPSS